MQVIKDMAIWRAIRRAMTNEHTLGFVPTMGNLHLGHASLCQQSVLENDKTVVSIFVNPTQFDRKDDFTHYPRTLEADIELLANTGVSYCLLPSEKDLYPDGYRFQLHERQKSLLMEGIHRPGHFDGVLTVVMKLLNMVKPNRAYFGEKDYQQYELINDMVHDFMLDIDIKSCPTIRETSGLAFSSRNNRLTPVQRQLAEQFATIFHKKLSIIETIDALNELGIKVEYVEEHQQRRFAAVFIGDIRLIDNYAVEC